MNTKRLRLAVCLCAAGQTWAQAPVQLDTVVVSGGPIIESNNVDKFSSFTTKASDVQLKELGALDLAAGLRMMPGVQISRYNEVGSYSGDQGGNVYIRGMGVSRPGGEIKTYVDGLPVYMGVWNHPLMDLLPLNGIGSITVRKGPDIQSGGNNFASINLETKRASQDGVRGEANASIGSYSTKTLHASLHGKSGNIDFMLAAGHVTSDGARQNADGELSNALGRITARINENWSAGLAFLAVDNEVGDPGDNRFRVSNVPVGPYSFSNGVGRNESNTGMLSAFVTHKHGSWQGELKVYENRGENNLKNDANWGTFDSRFEMSGFRWREQFSPWRGGTIVAQVERDTVKGKVSGPHVGAAVGTPFAFGVAGSAVVPEFRVLSTYLGVSQLVHLSPDWALQPSLGLRHYASNQYPSRTAPQAGVSLISDRVTFYGNIARGILYPGAETYTLTRAIPMAFAANNGWDRLDPSTSDHLEIGAQWDISKQTHLDISLFQDRIRDRYVWSGFAAGAFAPPASGVWSNNFPDYKTQGAELSARHHFNDDWTFFGGLTALDPSLDNLPYAPRSAVSLGANGNVAGYRVSVDVQHQSRMYALTQDRGAFNPNRVDGFTVANARIAHPLQVLGKGGEVYLAINNLFDADYAYNAGYPMTGRNLRVGVIAGF